MGSAKGASEFSFAVFKSTRTLPAELPLVLGDAIHNLNCALDYTISEIVHWGSKRIGFPSHEKREALVDSFRSEPEVVNGKTRKKGVNAPIKIAVDGLAEFIVNEIKPYAGGNDLLWAVSRLDNTDKHRMLTIIVIPQSIHDLVVRDDNHNKCHYSTATIGAGGEINLFGTGASGLHIESYGKTSAEIFFGEAGPVEGKPLFPTLIDMMKGVAKTIDMIEEFVLAAGWKAPV